MAEERISLVIELDAKRAAQVVRALGGDVTALRKEGAAAGPALAGGLREAEGAARGLGAELAVARDRLQGLREVGRVLGQAFQAPLQAAAAFETRIAEVGTLLDEGRAGAEGYREALVRMVSETGQRQTDLAGGLYEVISAFGEGADRLDILRINARAATGGLASLGEALALTSAVTKAYGDTSAGAVEKVADLAFQTVRLGKTNLRDLAAS